MGGGYGYCLELHNMREDNLQYLNSIMYNNSWKGNKDTILAFSSRSGECCNLTCKTFTLAYILAHSNKICGNLNLHERVNLCRKKMLLIHFYKTQRSILHSFLLRNLKRQCNWLQPMISHTYYLPTLISAPFNLSPQQSPLLSIFTSATGSTRPRSTLHQGSLSLSVCAHLL